MGDTVFVTSNVTRGREHRHPVRRPRDQVLGRPAPTRRAQHAGPPRLTLIATARATGLSGYLGQGTNRSPAGHTLDAGRVYRLALEHAPAGSPLHVVGDEGIPFRQIAETICRHLDVPTAAIPDDQAQAHFGFPASIVPLDIPASSTRAQQLLGCQPAHPGLIADLDQGHYFTAA